MIKIISDIVDVETIAENHSIRELTQLRKQYGSSQWKKKKGIALLELIDGSTAYAELHWYEAHGIGRVKMKIKRWL
jgi:hypothetical protein